MDNSRANAQSNPTYYNRSSLAVEVAEAYPEELQPLPQLVPKPSEAMVGIPKFSGLDTLTYQRNTRARTVSAIVHVVIIAGVLYLGFKSKTIVHAIKETPVNITLFAPAPPPPKVLPVAKAEGGGGGGGAHQIPPPTRGNPPKIVAPKPVNAPQILRINNPKLAVEPSEMVKMPENPQLANLGMTNSPQITLSQGSGSGSGFGKGLGGGIGMGHGIGSGPGSGGGYGGGVMSVGGGVSAPQVLHSVEPQFTEEARQANFQGNVAIQLIVDSQGNPQNVHVIRHAGMGLDEKAIEAVRQYKFRPAMFQGHPVAVQIIIDVDFHLH